MRVLIALTIVLYANICFSSTTKGKVLVLNSYHNGFLWSDEITSGIKEVLSDKVDMLHIEYMDTKRQYDTTYLNILTELIKYKHQKHQFDIIITSDNNAFDFINEKKEDIFGDIPSVFCGVNYISPKEISKYQNITGINERAEIRKNIVLIKQLHPSCDSILIVTDNTPTGKRIQNEIKKQSFLCDSLKIGLNIVFDVRANELKTKLNALKGNQVVLYTLFFRDKDDQFFEYDQSARFVCENSSVPVYGSWTFSLGYGIIGGHLANGYIQGKLAGNMAYEILCGKSITEVPVVYNPPTSLIFDFNQLNKYNIQPDQLNEHYTILNEPPSFLDKYENVIKYVILLLLLLSFSVVILIYFLRRMHVIKKQLHSSEKRLRSIIDNLPSFLFVKNAKGRFLAVNKKMAQSMGMLPNQMEGKYQKDLHPDKAEINMMLEEDLQVIKTQKELHLNTRPYHDYKSNVLWLQTIKVPCPIDVFGEEAVIGISMDVSQLRETKKNLFLANTLNQNIVDTSNVIIVTLDENHKITSFNRFAEQLTGFKKDEILGKNWLNIFMPHVKQDELDNFFSIQQNKPENYTNYENYILGKNGDKRIINWNISLLKNDDSVIYSVLCIGMDITEKKNAMERIKQSETKFKSIFNYSPIGILYYDTQGIILDCNEFFENLVGSSKEKLLGVDLTQFPDKKLVSAVKNSIKKGLGYYNDQYHSTMVDKITPIKAIFRSIKNDLGHTIGGIALAEDFTLQKENEEKILKWNKDLQESSTSLKKANVELNKALIIAKRSNELEIANELLVKQKQALKITLSKLKETQSQLIQSEKMATVGILTSGIAHEINNPLNFIQGGKTAIELLLEDDFEEKKAAFDPYLEMIDTGITRAVKIIQSLNRFNRKSDTYDENCNLSNIIDNCLVMTQSQMKHKVKIIKNYADQAIEFKGNEGKIHQVVLNILTNAEQAIDKDGVIHIETKIIQQHVQAIFTDNGSGISPDDLKKISDPFFTTKDPGKGTGLGLSIAYNIMNEHNGSIQYESELEKGTKVYITFPISETQPSLKA